MSQIKGAVGMGGSLSYGARNQIDNDQWTGMIEIMQDNLWVLRVISQDFDGTGSPAPPACDLHTVRVEYSTGAASPLVNSAEGDGFVTNHLVFGTPSQILNCNLNQTLDFKFALGTYNSGTGHHAADGSFELKVNGVVQLSMSGLALGLNNFPAWNNLRIHPSGIVDQGDNNGGISYLYYNDVDTYGASGASVINEVYSGLSDAVLFYDQNSSNPWVRYTFSGDASVGGSLGSPTGPVGHNVPFKVGDKLVADGSYMERVVTHAGLASPPTLTKTFSKATMAVGDTATLTFTMTNPNVSSLTNVEFDDTLPDGLLVANPNNLVNTGGLTGIFADEDQDFISIEGATLTSGAHTFSVDVVATTTGTKLNTTTGPEPGESIFATESGSAPSSTGVATATVIIEVQDPQWQLHRFDIKVRREERA